MDRRAADKRVAAVHGGRVGSLGRAADDERLVDDLLVPDSTRQGPYLWTPASAELVALVVGLSAVVAERRTAPQATARATVGSRTA